MRKMSLKSICNNNTEWLLKSNCEFDTLGMATSKYPDKKVLSFISDEKYFNSIINNKDIVGIICTEEIYKRYDELKNYGVIIAKDPKRAFFEIHNMLAKTEFYWKKFKNKISETSDVSNDAIIGEHSIEIGDNCIIEPGVVIHPGTIIGDNVIIRSGSQIGTSGFQFIKVKNDVIPVTTAGRVIIRDNVEIQHNCCIDRGVLGGDTVLDYNVKLDNFVHIAHDDYIGERTFITAGVKLSGRVVVGKDCWLGVNATVSNGINIGDNCRISLGSVVTKDVPSGTTVTGNFAIEHSKFIEFIKSIR
ncbi:UDP-3-O-(3-hydroxymyristoyl)glucosamine N-acyltransferase [Caloranaerobacter sp. TR13]|uniref:UDP-3-O-(3-hydroxymyristoyl)glucosamine N-acyltransferase n=1 Tax=Caloranaerobacter sp. TR13 TaxID=1302151 RepID=UPI0006D40288|nr:UDP-3-O-(3-hydroxymyristoyl)glucosamine N-acyltransferase [Caloranaerobacter sp. TR13]